MKRFKYNNTSSYTIYQTQQSSNILVFQIYDDGIQTKVGRQPIFITKILVTDFDIFWYYWILQFSAFEYYKT